MAVNGLADNATGEGFPEVGAAEAHFSEECITPKENCEESVPEVASEEYSIAPAKDGEKLKPNKLCGYLYKLGTKGPLKPWKYRFFSYDDKKCHLVYYRVASDVCPLGSINLCAATFSFSVEAEEGVFEIKTPAKTYVLKAVNNHTKMYWLQQLQLRRREFRKFFHRYQNVLPSKFPYTESDSPDTGDQEFLSPVKTPTEVVGVMVVSMPAPQESTSIQNISLKHPWKEIQNTVRNICGAKPSPLSRSVFHFDEVEQATEAREIIAKQPSKMSPSNFARRARKQNDSSASSQDSLLPETMTFEKMSSPQQQIHALMEELKSQKVHFSDRFTKNGPDY